MQDFLFGSVVGKQRLTFCIWLVAISKNLAEALREAQSLI